MKLSALSALPTASAPASTRALPKILTYDAMNSADMTKLGKLMRAGEGPRTGDAAVDQAHEGAQLVAQFYRDMLGRNSIDGRGSDIISVVHHDHQLNNAFWDGEKMFYGDGDGETFAPLSGALDVIGHEMTHGLTQHTSGLVYRGQSGALNESWSDVIGEAIEQWAENRAGFGTVDAAKAADWLIGEDVFTPGRAGDALRSMKMPGTAYKGDVQPAHMREYVHTFEDNGGVHINSGIPNRAAYEIAIALGSEKLVKIWYQAAVNHLGTHSDFAAAAQATVTAAQDLYGQGAEMQAVVQAWQAVGVLD